MNSTSVLVPYVITDIRSLTQQ